MAAAAPAAAAAAAAAVAAALAAAGAGEDLGRRLPGWAVGTLDTWQSCRSAADR
jgi:hypothetical protein